MNQPPGIKTNQRTLRAPVDVWYRSVLSQGTIMAGSSIFVTVKPFTQSFLICHPCKRAA
jgi:hypothetical protein